MDALIADFSAAHAAASNEPNADTLHAKGTALLKLAKAALGEAATTFKRGLELAPNDGRLQAGLDEAEHKAKRSKVDTIMDKMDTGLARCMQLVNEIRSTAAAPVDIAPSIPGFSAIPPVNMMLITANTGSCFENVELEVPFLSLLHNEINSSQADIAVIHFQEMCGKHWKTRNVLETCVEFTDKLLAGLEGYATPGMIFHPASGPEDKTFNALACIVFVKHALVEQDRVGVWDFSQGKRVALSDVAGGGDGANLDRLCQSATLPSKPFPLIKVGRKGFLHTRLVVDEVPLDLVNLHMFHDDSNVVSYEEDYPCTFAQYRRIALDFVAEHAKMASMQHAFAFGDFNFRLNMQEVVSELLGAPKAELQHDVNEEKDRQVTVVNKATGKRVLIGKKKFNAYDLGATFINDWRRFRKFDYEARDTVHKLGFSDLDINFAPSYPFHEDPQRCNEYMPTRCPGWCDRVFMSGATRAAIGNTEYGVMGLDKSIGDHKPVFLRCSFAPHAAK